MLRREIPKPLLRQAVEASIDAAPQLRHWLDWKGEAYVSVAASVDARKTLRSQLYNFLPMDAGTTAPMPCFVDAPFFADIDRRNANLGLALNSYLLTAVAETCAAFALGPSTADDRVPQHVGLDFVSWSDAHLNALQTAFGRRGVHLAAAQVIPVVSVRGERRWTDIHHAVLWPLTKLVIFQQRRVVALTDAPLIAPVSVDRMKAIERLARSVAYRSLSPTDSQIAGWAEAMARDMASAAKRPPGQWSVFYAELTQLIGAVRGDLAALRGRLILLERGGTVGVAGSDDNGRIAFYRNPDRQGQTRTFPLPPAAIARNWRFLDDRVVLSAEALLAFEKAGLVKEYDAIAALSAIEAAFTGRVRGAARAEALGWAFRVWRAEPQAAAGPLSRSEIRVPTSDGWTAASEASFSASWTALGRTLEAYLAETKELSEDCSEAADSLLVEFDRWPCDVRDASKKQWRDFLEVVGVVDGLRPQASRPFPYPSGSLWNNLMRNGNETLGCNKAWRDAIAGMLVNHPYTAYRQKGELWRLPGQIEYDLMPASARERLSDLIVAYLKRGVREHLEIRIGRFERNVGYRDEHVLPTPLAVFLRTAAWLKLQVGNEVVLGRPAEGWASTVGRTPRFVRHVEHSLGEELTEEGDFARLMFGPFVGLGDWSTPATALRRLTDLAESFGGLVDADRSVFRGQYRNAWSDVATANITLRPDLRLIVRRFGRNELIARDDLQQSLLVAADDRTFPARALASAGRAVLAVEESEIAAVVAALNAASIPSARLEDVEVRLVVDGETFVQRPFDPPLVTRDLEWLPRLLLLAHEVRADGFERRAQASSLEDRLRSIRIRFCSAWSLSIDGRVARPEGASIYAVNDARRPTLVISGASELSWSTLLDAAPYISQLLDARLRTFEWALLRLNVYVSELREPSEQELAQAIGTDVSVVREHAAGILGDIDRARRLVSGLVAYYCGVDEALEFVSKAPGTLERIRSWLTENLTAGGPGAETLITTCQELASPSDIRERLSLDFARYNMALLAIGEPPLNDEQELRRQFAAFMVEIRPALVDRLRAHYRETFQSRQSLAKYVEQKALDFVTFDPTWVATTDLLDRATITSHASRCLEALIGPDKAVGIRLPALDRLLDGNRRAVRSAAEEMLPLVRAWCAKNEARVPDIWNVADASAVPLALENAGLLDFEQISGEDVPSLLARISVWPPGMPEACSLDALGLDDAEIRSENEQRKAEVEANARRRRSIVFAGEAVDTAAPDFADHLVELANKNTQREWFPSFKLVRLREVVSSDETRDQSRGARGGLWRQRPQASDAQKKAMGLFGEWLAYQYLRRKYGPLADENCWISSSRALFMAGGTGDDAAGFDFRVRTIDTEWMYEVKAAMDDSCEFEFTANEMTVAASASADRRRKYRILFVPYVFDPDRWTVLELPNPMGDATSNRYRIIGRASSRLRFERY